jgi:uncharacterized protein (TIGR00297 family)
VPRRIDASCGQEEGGIRLGEPVQALVVTGLCAALAFGLRMVSLGGAVGGLAVGTVVYYCLGPQGFAILALFVVGGSVLTRIGYRGKQSRGAAQERGGRRGAKNAFANCAVAVVCGVLSAATGQEVFAAAFVASLGAAFADTAESEVGQLARGRPRLVTTLRPVAPGTDGAVSLPGTLAGFAAAALTALLGLILGLMGGWDTALAAALAAFLGTVADSFVGALAPRVGNEATNALCTLTAAVLVVLFLAQG